MFRAAWLMSNYGVRGHAHEGGNGMRIQPEIDEVGVVLVGSLNPAIFTPAWFALHGLLPESAAESAELEVAHPQLTRFSTDWLRL